ncbi:hypothetical protein [Micromonospora marina]|uniref:hypothetical protein n=1 Tax=Micromonospora marina TaxID=307120 RepID=UPI003455005B
MTQAALPTAHAALETWYRRLLLVYPGHYRRQHGSEILTTLMETSDPRQTRPTRADIIDLLRGGLRQRFRLPDGRRVFRVMAVLAICAFGGFGAAAGSWLGERTFADLSSTAEVNRLSDVIAGPPAGAPQKLPAVPVLSPASAATIGGGTGAINASGWTAEQAVARLAEEGWALRHHKPAAPTEFGCTGEIAAARAGLVLIVDECHTDGALALKTTIFAERSGAYLPLTIAGAAAGIIAGWLLTASVAYRMRSMPPPRRIAIGLITALGLILAAPALLAFAGQVPALLTTLDDSSRAVQVLHAPLKPEEYYTFGPPYMTGVAAIAALLCAFATIVVSRRKSHTTPVSLTLTG